MGSPLAPHARPAQPDFSDPLIARVLAQLEDDLADAPPLLARLVRIPSITGSDAEHEAQAMLAGWLRVAGFDVDHWRIDLEAVRAAPGCPGSEAPREEAWGLVGRLPGTDGDAPTLLLNGHVDIVPPADPNAWSRDPFSAAFEGGLLHGRGACDMKGGLVALLLAARAVRRSGVRLRGDLLVTSVASEEDGGLGTFATLQRGWRADACLIPEPTGLDVVPACAGALTFRLVLRGLATHASRRTEGVSVIDKLVPLLASLRALEGRRNASVDPLMQRWSIAYPLELGTVRAGDWASTVPDLLVAEGRLGVALDESVEHARQALEAAVAAMCTGDSWLADHPVQVDWWGGQFAPGRLLPGRIGTMFEQTLMHAHAAVSRRPVQRWGVPYGSDLRLLEAAGVPALHYGPGDAAWAHAADERIPMPEVLTAARTMAVLAVIHCRAG